MKLRIIKYGRAAYPEIRALVAMYQERCQAFAKVEGEEWKDAADDSRILRTLGAGTRLVLLDERGRDFSSGELADQVRRWQEDPGVKEIILVIGGPLGLPPSLRTHAAQTWRLSRATLTSDMAWLLTWEQFYRAFNILAGTGYHHA